MAGRVKRLWSCWRETEGPDAGEFFPAGIDSEEMSELAPNLEDEAGEQAKLEGTRLDVSVALAGEYASSMAKLLEQTTVFDPLQLGEGEAARDGNLTLLATEDGEYVSYEDLCRQHMGAVPAGSGTVYEGDEAGEAGE